MIEILIIIGFAFLSLFLFRKGLMEQGSDVISRSMRVRYVGVSIICLMVIMGIIINYLSE
jgi:hypothetical protein